MSDFRDAHGCRGKRQLYSGRHQFYRRLDRCYRDAQHQRTSSGTLVCWIFWDERQFWFGDVNSPQTLDARGSGITGCSVKSGTTALPTGLSVNSSTCVISGTPTVTVSNGSYTLVATNSVGDSSDANITLNISAAVPTLSYSASTGTTVQVSAAMNVSPSTLTNGGSTVTACAIKESTTPLPTGLTINSSTCVISGTVNVQTPSATYTIVATNAVGNSADASVTLAISTDYTVTYHGNGNTGGSAPNDANGYAEGATVTAAANTGSLVKTGYAFAGWNTAADGSGTNRAGGSTFAMGGTNVTLYAKWVTGYTITYNANTPTSGSAPTDATYYAASSTATVSGNTGNLVKTSYAIGGWNTLANGTGTTYTAGQSYTFGSANITLYAKWVTAYTVTYNSNSATSGSVPTDSTNYANGDTATVLSNSGNLVRTGYAFDGWNTNSAGTGTARAVSSTFTMGASSVTLYARWSLVYTVTYNANTPTSGTAPTDSTSYPTGSTVTTLSNSGNLVKTNFAFSGWNTNSSGTGTTYATGATFTNLCGWSGCWFCFKYLLSVRNR